MKNDNQTSRQILLLAICIMLGLACARTQNSMGPGNSNMGPLPLGANFASIQSNILTPKCAVSGCHVQGGGLPSFENGLAYNNLVGAVTAGYAPNLRVRAGDPANSVMYQKVTGGNGFGGAMPPGGSLTQSQMDTIRAWILLGAKNDAPSAAGAGATLNQLQATLFTPNCTGCHTEATPRPNGAPFSLQNVNSTHANLVNARSLRSVKADSIRVVPGRSDLSYLVRLVQGNGDAPTPQMPPLATGNSLTSAQIQTIQSWINAGALNN